MWTTSPFLWNRSLPHRWLYPPGTVPPLLSSTQMHGFHHNLWLGAGAQNSELQNALQTLCGFDHVQTPQPAPYYRLFLFLSVDFDWRWHRLSTATAAPYVWGATGTLATPSVRRRRCHSGCTRSPSLPFRSPTCSPCTNALFLINVTPWQVIPQPRSHLRQYILTDRQLCRSHLARCPRRWYDCRVQKRSGHPGLCEFQPDSSGERGSCLSPTVPFVSSEHHQAHQRRFLLFADDVHLVLEVLNPFCLLLGVGSLRVGMDRRSYELGQLLLALFGW